LPKCVGNGKRGDTVHMDFMQILHDYSGTISTLAGTTVAYIFTYVSKNYFGSLKLYFYEDHIDIQMHRLHKPEKIIEEVLTGELKAFIDIYNSKEIPISLRDIHIKIGKRTRVKEKLTYQNTNERTSYKFTYLNIPPKQLMSYSIYIRLHDSEVQEITKHKEKLFFVAIDQNENKVIKEITPQITIN